MQKRCLFLRSRAPALSIPAVKVMFKHLVTMNKAMLMNASIEVSISFTAVKFKC